MYAVIVSGGKQYRVKPGQLIRLEKIEKAPGESVEFDKVLMIADGNNIQVGGPYVNGGKVTAVIENHGRNEKISVIKFKRRKHHMKHMGHRQWFTEVKIAEISGVA